MGPNCLNIPFYNTKILFPSATKAQSQPLTTTFNLHIVASHLDHPQPSTTSVRPTLTIVGRPRRIHRCTPLWVEKPMSQALLRKIVLGLATPPQVVPQNVPTDCFCRNFHKLPPELELSVWRYAVKFIEPRVVHVCVTEAGERMVSYALMPSLFHVW